MDGLGAETPLRWMASPLKRVSGERRAAPFVSPGGPSALVDDGLDDMDDEIESRMLILHKTMQVLEFLESGDE